MLRLSKLTDYAVVVLTRLEEAEDGGVLTAPGLAAATGLGEPTVAKVLKILSHAGLVEGRRGAAGGYRLVRPLAEMPLTEVIAAIDGPIALTACAEAEARAPVCTRTAPRPYPIRDSMSVRVDGSSGRPAEPSTS